MLNYFYNKTSILFGLVALETKWLTSNNERINRDFSTLIVSLGVVMEPVKWLMEAV